MTDEEWATRYAELDEDGFSRCDLIRLFIDSEQELARLTDGPSIRLEWENATIILRLATEGDTGDFDADGFMMALARLLHDNL